MIFWTKIFFVVVICCTPILLLSQSNINKVYFVEYQTKSDSQSFSGTYQFEYTRIYNKDGSFREKGLFATDTTNKYNTTDVFKVKNGCWYIKIKTKWEIFFNGGKAVSTIVRINDHNFRLIWKKTTFFDNDKIIYRLELKPVGVSISGLGIYYFTPKDGFVAIDGHDYFTVRVDKRYLNLQ